MANDKKGLLAAVLTAFAIVTAPVAALDLTNVAFTQAAEGAATIPVGHMEFCQTHPAECQPNQTVVAAASLDEQSWQQLVAVNAYYNQSVVPVTDDDLYHVAEFWTYPNGFGDCEDFALAKRRDLINAGWPASTLLIAVVKEPNGNGHAVLLARTDRGDFVLDNQDGVIRLWNETPYKFVKRQSQAHSGQWVDMLDARTTVATTAGF
jgi:predicted transglutaminase-like cysteine proteinase